MRKPGPLNIQELRDYQVRNGLLVDGEFGDQSMGSVLELEDSLDKAKALFVALKAHDERLYADLQRQIEKLRAENEYLHHEADKPWWERLFGG